MLLLGAVPEIEVAADPDQFEQLLINLVKNAVEAVIIAREEADAKVLATEASAAVTLRASELTTSVAILIEDTGLGLSNTANLFVPFYTTKKNGSRLGRPCAGAADRRGRTAARSRYATGRTAPGCVAGGCFCRLRSRGQNLKR